MDKKRVLVILQITFLSLFILCCALFAGSKTGITGFATHNAFGGNVDSLNLSADTYTPSGEVVALVEGGSNNGGGFDFCGDSKCNNKEDCYSCPKDCGLCSFREIPNNKNFARYLLDFAKELVFENEKCNMFNEILVKAENEFTDKNYVECILDSRTIIEGCMKEVQKEKKVEEPALVYWEMSDFIIIGLGGGFLVLLLLVSYKLGRTAQESTKQKIVETLKSNNL